MLSEAQLADFERDGYLLVREMYDAEEMRDVLAWTNEVTNYPEVPGKYMMYFEQSSLDKQRILSRMEDFEPYHAGFSHLFMRSIKSSKPVPSAKVPGFGKMSYYFWW